MKIKTMVLLIALPLAASCGSGEEDQAASDTPEQAAAADPEAEAAFTKLLECNSVTGSAYSLIGGETMFAEGDEKTALTEIETTLRARKNELQPRMEADGAALGPDIGSHH